MPDMTTDMPNINSAVAEEVRVLMARRRINQTQIAEALGLNQSTMSRRLRGTQPFTLPELEAVAEFFDVPITDLFGGFRTGSSSTLDGIPGQGCLDLALGA